MLFIVSAGSDSHLFELIYFNVTLRSRILLSINIGISKSWTMIRFLIHSTIMRVKSELMTGISTLGVLIGSSSELELETFLIFSKF